MCCVRRINKVKMSNTCSANYSSWGFFTVAESHWNDESVSTGDKWKEKEWKREVQFIAPETTGISLSVNFPYRYAHDRLFQNLQVAANLWRK